MTDRHQHTAQRVVAEFKELLDPDARQRITDTQFQDLELLVRSAIADELAAAAELVEDVLQKIRSEVEKPELGL